jgi:hypothetical protein
MVMITNFKIHIFLAICKLEAEHRLSLVFLLLYMVINKPKKNGLNFLHDS